MGLVSIKTRVNEPFIYFLIEPTVVFVYRVETEEYLTELDLFNGEPFELTHSDDFETFDHEEGKLLEGRGFCINQDGMNEMVEEVNRYIQKKRQKRNQHGAVHIVTSESAAGSLRVALQHPKTVIGFPDAFLIGPLWKLDEKVGQRTRTEWLYENINDEQEDGQYEHKFNNTLREIEDIAGHTPIYIWTGDNADEQTGLRFYLYLLREKPNEIYLMKATEEGEDIFHTRQMESESLRREFDENQEKKPLTEKERLQFQREWEELAKTKDVLRLWEDDEIKSVPADHYDPLILEVIENLHNAQAEKDFIHTGNVIGEVLVKIDAYLDFYFLEYRIRHLVYSGALELKGIPKSVRHYRVKLR